MNQTSPWDAEIRQPGAMTVSVPVCSSGEKSAASASVPLGTQPASGHWLPATSRPLASRPVALYSGWTSSPCSVVPFGSKKKPPTVSPAQTPPSGPMMPATWRPELKTYWSAVPFGQKPPPMVEELVESTQTRPSDARPQ